MTIAFLMLRYLGYRAYLIQMSLFFYFFFFLFEMPEDQRRNLFSFFILAFRFTIAIKCLMTTFVIQRFLDGILYFQTSVEDLFVARTRLHLVIFLLLVFIVKYISYGSGAHCMYMYCIKKKYRQISVILNTGSSKTYL